MRLSALRMPPQRPNGWADPAAHRRPDWLCGGTAHMVLVSTVILVGPHTNRRYVIAPSSSSVDAARSFTMAKKGSGKFSVWQLSNWPVAACLIATPCPSIEFDGQIAPARGSVDKKSSYHNYHCPPSPSGNAELSNHALLGLTLALSRLASWIEA
jgi:hypothetical protein